MNLEVEDIEKQQETEEALKASQTELLALFNAIEDVILVVSAEGKYLKVAPSSAPSLYKPPAEIVGKTVNEVFPPAFADYFLHYMKQTVATKKTVKIEYSLPIGDQEVWFEASIAPMGEDNVVIVARDINDRKRLEDQLRQQAQDLEKTLQELKRTQTPDAPFRKNVKSGTISSRSSSRNQQPCKFYSW